MSTTRRGERGMVTAELAVAVPALLLVLVLAVSAVLLGIDEVRCVDAARAGVRVLARGEGTAGAVREARRAAPEGAQVELSSQGAHVVVTVTGQTPRPLRLIGVGHRPRASAVALNESWFGQAPSEGGT